MEYFLAWQVRGDGFATATMRALLSFMSRHGGGPLGLGRFRRLDGGEYFCLVEQHLLIRRDTRTRQLLRGAAVDVILQEAHFFLEQHLALEGMAMLCLKLLVGLFYLPQRLFSDFQPRRKFGVLIQQLCCAR